MLKFKFIVISFAIFTLICASSSCALFKKNCDCPSFGQIQLNQYEADSTHVSVELTANQFLNID